MILSTVSTAGPWRGEKEKEYCLPINLPPLNTNIINIQSIDSYQSLHPLWNVAKVKGNNHLLKKPAFFGAQYWEEQIRKLISEKQNKPTDKPYHTMMTVLYKPICPFPET